MSRSRLPPEPGFPPPKVVFKGVPEGSEEAENLYNQYRGQIARFHHRARQSATLGDMPQFKLQARLEGDVGRAQYIRNNGQETITVELTNEIVVEAPRKRMEKPIELPRWLIVDVITDPRVRYANHIATNVVEHDGSGGTVVNTGTIDVYGWEGPLGCGVEITRQGQSYFAHNIVGVLNDPVVGAVIDYDTTFGGLKYGDPVFFANAKLVWPWDNPAKVISTPDDFWTGTCPVFPYIPNGTQEGLWCSSFIVRIDDPSVPIDLKVYGTTTLGFGELEYWEYRVGGMGPNTTTGTATMLTDVRFRVQVREILGSWSTVDIASAALGDAQYAGETGVLSIIPNQFWYGMIPVQNVNWEGDPLNPGSADATSMGRQLAITDITVRDLPPGTGLTYPQDSDDPETFYQAPSSGNLDGQIYWRHALKENMTPFADIHWLPGMTVPGTGARMESTATIKQY